MIRQQSMKNAQTNWVDWWDRETIVEEVTWQKNMQHFLDATTSLVHYNAQDVVLDIGCGPGYLASSLKDTVKEIHCLDTSERYLAICREKFSNDKNVLMHCLPHDNYTDLRFLEPNRFSVIICLSVIQYYRSFEEVDRLLDSIKRIALPHARAMIVDIPLMTSQFMDTVMLLKSAIVHRRVHETAKLLFRLLASQHSKDYAALKLLRFSYAQLEKLLAQHQLQGNILTTPITANTNRAHLFMSL